MGKKSRKVLATLYILIVLWITLFSRTPGTVRLFRGLFWEIEMGYWGDIALNILLFVPLGFLVGNKRIILIGLLLSAGIELTQFVFELGVCELDDVLNNTIGAAVGCLIATLLRTRGNDMYRKVVKNVFDFLIGLCGFPFFLIAFVIFGPIIYMQSPGPVFFSQMRVGKNGRKFRIYKFRSMYMDAEERKKELMKENKMNGLMFKMDDDPRIIPIGKFIRKYSIDEFPQFWNVLKGDMSLVGTRPPTVDEYEQYDLHHKVRLSIKPGLTGMWQVSGRSNITDFEEVVKLDTKYIDEWDLGEDVKILAKTFKVVWGDEGAM